MKALRAVLLWLLALIALALSSWAVTLYLDWQIWASIALFFGVLGFYMLVRTLRRLILVWRSRSITAAEQRVDDDVAQDRSPRDDLQRKFRDAIERLRRSSLKRLGNPLYVLPWYMVIGHPGAGKTTALARSGLATSLKDETRQGVPVPPTRNCDWWYFDRSIVLDCAGRYVDADVLENDRDEWDLALDLLSRYRGRQGINGMVLAISASRLLEPDCEGLDAEGRVIRAQIEKLIRLFGWRFPVYVLVTKCDQLYGFERWSEVLPQSALEQAMGHLAPQREDDTPTRTFISSAFATIASRLHELRIGLIAQHPEAAVELLLFPDELERLRAGVDLFVNSCVGKSPYLESPFLRGLFFSSGQLEGGARSIVLPSSLRPTPAHRPSGTGVFLHDLFGRILPQDRNASRPATLVNSWFSATQRLGILAWLMLALALGVLITMSFIRNVSTLQEIQAIYPFQQQFDGLLVDDAATLTKVSDSILAVDRRNQSWSSHWMISNELDTLIQKIHERYVDQYSRIIRPAVQRDSNLELNRYLISDPDNHLPVYILNEIRITNLLKARLAGAGLPKLNAMPQPLYSGPTPWTSQLFAQLNRLRISYIAWSATNARDIISQVEQQQAALDDAMYRDQMHWLTQLAPFDSHLADVTLAELWLNSDEARAQSLLATNLRLAASDTVAIGHMTGRVSESPSNSQQVSDQRAAAQQAEQHRLASINVPAAYTRAGKADIDGYLAEARDAVADNARLNKQVKIFQTQYRKDRFETWLSFVQNVPQGEDMLAGRDAWRSRLVTIAGSASPYMGALVAVNQEFGDFSYDQLPDWLQTARRLGKLRQDAIGALMTSKAGSLLQNINSYGGKAIHQMITSKPAAGAESLRLGAQATSALRDYLQSVNGIAATVADGTAKAYQVIADFHGFGVDPAVKTSALHDAARALTKVRSHFGSAGPSDQVIWNLIGGPLHFLLTYTEEEASCALQAKWDATIYWPLRSATGLSQVMDQLYGERGSVWGFVDGPAKPFLKRSASAISIVETAGYSVPFTSPFLPTLNTAVGKRVAQLIAAQRAKVFADTDLAKAQAEQDQAKQQQANAQQTIAEIRQQIATMQSKTYPLMITAMPTDVNASARLRPFATMLTMQCSDGPHMLTNFNFPASDSFNWTPGQCGEVTLRIRFDGITLTKHYRGDTGVVSFLHDFHDGHHLFTPADFPFLQDSLAQRSIQQIDVRYNFRGEDAIIAASRQLDELLDQQRLQTQVRKQAIDAQATQTQKLLMIKIASANDTSETPLRVMLPQQIGMCWNVLSNPTSDTTLQQRFDSLMDPHGALTTSYAVPANVGDYSSPMSAPDVPPLPTVPLPVAEPTRVPDGSTP